MFDLVLITAIVCVGVLSCACIGWIVVDRRAEHNRKIWEAKRDRYTL